MNSVNLRDFWERLGFRSRLTLCLSGLFAMILAVGYWSLFLEFQEELQNDFDRSLHNYATDLLQNVQLNAGGQADLPYEVIFSGDKVFPFPHGDALVKIYQRPFTELFSYSTDTDAPKKLDLVRAYVTRNQDNQFIDLTSETGSLWRGVLMQVDDIPVTEFYFFVAVPRQSLTNQESKFRSIFIAGQLLILLLSALMISVLARGLLKSLELLTQSIHEMPLSSSNFNFFVPDGPPEITLLAKLLNQLLGRLRQSLTAHQEFVAQAAHQLKTPLTIARGHLEQGVIASGSISDHNLTVAIEELDLMSGTITHLLNLVQIESGFQTLRFVEVDLLDQLLTQIDRFDYLARKKALKFQVQCDDPNGDPNSSHWTTQTDLQLFAILLTNILENAIKYASASPIEVKMNLKEEKLVISISNRTQGGFTNISVADLKDKFTRGDSPEPGQGLGLYIAYKIASILKIHLALNQLQGVFRVTLEIPKNPNLQNSRI
jgi:signal transduction histidine kinase